MEEANFLTKYGSRVYIVHRREAFRASKIMQTVEDTMNVGAETAVALKAQVILVGHSAGGLSLVHIMHEFGEKIDVAIFIAAAMLPSGYVSEEDKKIFGTQYLSKYGDIFDKKFSQGNNSAPTSITLKKEFEHELMYQLSPRKDSTLASKLLRPWPIQAINSARFERGEEKAKRVRRVFIKTRHDRMVDPKNQDAMIRRWPPSKVLVINTDHSPFFSAPKTLTELIIQAAVSK